MPATSVESPYRGQSVLMATMHGKERAVAPPFWRVLGARVEVASADIDTDAFGTFTGEVPRSGTMLDAARAKVRLVSEVTGAQYILASEGSFGPHPSLPFVSANNELLLFVDGKFGLEVTELLTTLRTNYSNQVFAPDDDLSAFLAAMRFPSHAVVVSPHQPSGVFRAIKGIVCADALKRAIAELATLSLDAKVRIGSDMRAHVNPTRMAVIRAAGYRLARRLATPCPSCRAPGFGFAGPVRGLPCEWCGRPTRLAMAQIHRCSHCGFEERKPLRSAPVAAKPMYCDHCNP